MQKNISEIHSSCSALTLTFRKLFQVHSSLKSFANDVHNFTKKFVANCSTWFVKQIQKKSKDPILKVDLIIHKFCKTILQTVPQKKNSLSQSPFSKLPVLKVVSVFTTQKRTKRSTFYHFLIWTPKDIPKLFLSYIDCSRVSQKNNIRPVFLYVNSISWKLRELVLDLLYLATEFLLIIPTKKLKMTKKVPSVSVWPDNSEKYSPGLVDKICCKKFSVDYSVILVQTRRKRTSLYPNHSLLFWNL